jgi:beta-lactam-binding protein with PASTA domain
VERILRVLAHTPPGPLAALVAIAGLVFMSSAPDAAARVPSFRGMQVNPAIAKAADAGYFAKVTFVRGGGLPGTVIGQTPEPLEIRDKGSDITLRVTEGKAQVRIPDVRGVHVDEARRRLDRGNVTPGDVIYRDDSKVPRDRVITTKPAPGKLVDVGTTVDLIAAD